MADTWVTSIISVLFENRVVRVMLELSTRLIHRDWPVINIPDVCQMDTK